MMTGRNGTVLDLLALPQLATPELTQRARAFFTVVVTTMVVVTTLLIPLGLLNPQLLDRAITTIAMVDGLGLALILVNSRGATRVASWLLVLGLMAVVTHRSFDQGGIESPGASVYILLPIMAGVLLGERAGIRTGILCTAIGLALVAAEMQGRLPPQTVFFNPFARWLLNTVYLAVGLGLMRLMTRAHSAALRTAEAELAERRAVEKKQEQLVIDLGERVKELRLLHATSRVIHRRPFSRDVLEEIVLMMPGGWMHPECCRARIQYGDIEVTTAGWRDTPWRHAATFTAANRSGTVEVAYTEERPPADEGPFLAEERHLLESLADMLRSYIEREEAERQKRELELQLRHAQKMEALGTLAGGIAHDFNNILTAIVGNASMALHEAPDGRFREHLSEIEKASARATDLVRRILLFSRRSESERRVTNLRVPIAEALALLKTTIPPSVEIRSRYDADLPLVFADHTQIHQVIMNLAMNAAHAMRQGGVLSVEAARLVVTDLPSAPSVDLRPGTHARISVRDTGSGISPEIVTRLFEPFFTTKGVEGTGLGLSVVHGIVRDHGGAITVESEVGRGTAFHVYLPEAETGELPYPAASRIEHGSGEHVMYVDDEETLVFLATRLITRLGYKCTGYTSAEEALEALRSDPAGIDALVTDFAMPAMSGIDLARKAREIRPDLPVAIMSGYGEVPAVSGDNLVDLRIAKPVTLETLSVAIHALVNQVV
jgi:signal transduction histidine kinase